LVALTRSGDIDIINCLQVQNADEHLYFKDESESVHVRQLINRFGRLRGRMRGFARTIEADDAGATRSSFVAFEMPEVRIPLPWSFCHVRKGISSRSFGLRDPELNAQLDQYHRDILMKERLVPFHVWRSEQEMLRRLRID
jgi:hypothetical protein